MLRTLPGALSELQPALNSAPLQPLFALELPKLLLGTALGVPPLPLVQVVPLLFKPLLIGLLQSQYPLELPNPNTCIGTATQFNFVVSSLRAD